MSTGPGLGGCECEFYACAPEHHDQLRSIEHGSFDVITGVVEMAVTWHELDYSEQLVIGPDDWLEFVKAHQWKDSDRVVDFFVALQSLVRVSVSPGLALVLPLGPSDEQSDGAAVGSRSQGSLVH